MSETPTPIYRVTGAAVVLGLRGGSERYLYRGAIVARDAYLAASIEHAVSVGLLVEVEPVEPAAVVVEPAEAAVESAAVVAEPAETTDEPSAAKKTSARSATAK